MKRGIIERIGGIIMKSKVIAIVNQKGGVGKTTTTLNLGYALSDQGKKVLLIDLDPQGSLSISMGLDDNDELENTIATLMAFEIEDRVLPEKEKYIIHIGELDLIACNIELSAIEVSLVNAMSREMILKCIIQQFKNDYDYIIIDCSPSLGMLTINALAACDSVIIPVTAEFLSAKGLELLLMNIMRTRKKINPGITVDGILLTMYMERMNLSKKVKKIIEEAYSEQIRIYKTYIPKSVRVGESILESKSIIEFDKSNKVSVAYQHFAQEVLEYEQ